MSDKEMALTDQQFIKEWRNEDSRDYFTVANVLQEALDRLENRAHPDAIYREALLKFLTTEAEKGMDERDQEKVDTIWDMIMILKSGRSSLPSTTNGGERWEKLKEWLDESAQEMVGSEDFWGIMLGDIRRKMSELEALPAQGEERG